jgi:hypothetical protein
VAQIPFRRDGAESLPLWSSEDSVDDPTLDQGAEERYILGSIEKLDEPGAGAQYSDRVSPTANPRRCEGPFEFRQIFPAQDLPHCRHIKPEKHRERHLFRGFDKLALNGSIDR